MALLISLEPLLPPIINTVFLFSSSLKLEALVVFIFIFFISDLTGLPVNTILFLSKNLSRLS